MIPLIITLLQWEFVVTTIVIFFGVLAAAQPARVFPSGIRHGDVALVANGAKSLTLMS